LYVVLMLGALMALAGGVASLTGCSADQLQRAKATKQDAQTVLNATTQAVGALQKQLDAMPADDPGRPKLKELVDKGNQVIAAANKAIGVADGTIKSIETGQVDPSLTNALQGVPYGPYALAALAAGFGVWRLIKQKKTDATLGAVVDSWQQVVAPLTEPEKRKVAAIQGPAATAAVHAVKAKLAAAAPAPPAAPATS
jgi:hypothetical protein